MYPLRIFLFIKPNLNWLTQRLFIGSYNWQVQGVCWASDTARVQKFKWCHCNQVFLFSLGSSLLDSITKHNVLTSDSVRLTLVVARFAFQFYAFVLVLYPAFSLDFFFSFNFCIVVKYTAFKTYHCNHFSSVQFGATKHINNVVPLLTPSVSRTLHLGKLKLYTQWILASQLLLSLSPQQSPLYFLSPWF